MTHKSWGLTLYLAYALTLLLVIVTIFAFALRYGISKLGENPDWLKNWVASELNAQIEFADLAIEALGNTVLLRVNNLNATDIKTQVPIFGAEHIELRINWLKSAVNFALKTDLIRLESPFVALTHHTEGHLSLGSVATLKADKSKSQLNHWIFEQKRIFMTNLSLDFYSERSLKNWQIDNASLSVIPSGTGRKIQLKSKLPEEGFIDVRMQWTGNMAGIAGWSGRAYIQGKNLPAELFANFAPNKNFRINKSLVDITGQINWQKGQMRSGYGEFTVAKTSFHNLLSDKTFRVGTITGNFVTQIKQGIAKTKFNLNLPKSEFTNKIGLEFFVINSARGIDFAMHDANLDLVKFFAPLFVSQQTLNTINQVQPEVLFKHIQVSILSTKDISLDQIQGRLRFSNLKFNKTAKTPGISATDGLVSISGSNIKVRFNSENLTLDFPRVYFRKPLYLGKAQGAFTLSFMNDQKWVLEADKIIASTFDANAGLAMRMRSVPGQKRPFIELVGNFNGVSAARVPDYLPISEINPRAIAWLDKAFGQARVTNGKVQVHEDLNQKPFISQQTSNIRNISMDVAEAELFYQSGWPKIKKINGSLSFKGRGMLVKIKSAGSLGVNVHSLQAVIPDFEEPGGAKLQISLKSNSNLKAIRKFLLKTPLKKTFSEFLSNFHINGKARLNLGLNILLENNKTNPKVKGTIEFAKAGFGVLPLALDLDNLAGKIKFTENSVESEKITGQMQKQKITGRITTKINFAQKNGLIELVANAKLGGKYITDKSDFLLPDLRGATSWHGIFRFRKNGNNSAQISSALKGLAVYLPDIINKSKNQQIKNGFNLVCNWNKTGTINTKFNLQNKIKGNISKTKKSPWTGGIRFLKGKVQQSQSGIMLSGSLPSFNIDNWNKWLSKRRGLRGTSRQKLFLSGHVNDLKLAQNNYKNVKLNADLDNDKLQARFKAEKLDGNAVVHFDNGPIEIDLDRFVMDSFSSKSNASTVKMTERKISLNIKSLFLKQKNLGHFKVHLIPTSTGTNISRLALTSGAFVLRGSGVWDKISNLTSLGFKLNAAKLERFMRLFGYGGKIAGAATQINLKTNWLGYPGSFSLSRLNGSGNLHVGNGEFKDVKSTGKGLLNLLKFNFSLLKKSGLDFRNITGNFTIKNGVANTSNTRVNSSAVDILFRGNTNLAQQTLGLNVILTPKISGALPLIGIAVAGIPGLIAGGAVATINKVSGSKVDKAVRKKINISGSWDNPKVNILKRSNKNQYNKDDLLGLPTYD